MPAEVNVPLTTYERLQKYKDEFTNALRHPDSPEWFSKEVNEKLKKELLWAAPYDARFPQDCYRKIIIDNLISIISDKKDNAT
ncbi:hypothetical protein ANCCAN_13492 [Ancylostoma caninum]|uniref:Uncharacterized protein n=1 Tax=Ancylostoma caninum TaxID=29170 RepID=A0A368GCR8_ANCCA|nr:hypothetical protein ANCCAN_13492 [Ancylostoma caninum]